MNSKDFIMGCNYWASNAGAEMEMSRYVQSKNPLNLKYTQYRICFSECSVAKRGKTDSRAAVSSCGFPAAV